jgi:tetratricopeptide (TPR) repeat protein
MPRFNDDDELEPEEGEWEGEELEEDEDAELEDEDLEEEDGAAPLYDDEVSSELQELIDEAEDLAEQGELKKSLRLWRRNMDRYSDEPIAYYHLALATFRLLNEELMTSGAWDSTAELAVLHEEAITALDECLAMNKKFVAAWNLLGALHMMREEYKDAVKAWEASLELDEDQDEVRSDLEEARKYIR